MSKQISKGKCNLCNATFNKAAMTKHLESCTQKEGILHPSSDKGRLQETKMFHIVVEGRYLPEYWMHIEAPAKVTLAGLDDFLRDIWLECCGHLSAFTIGKTTYFSDLCDEDDDRDMNVALGDVLSSGIKFHHEYDFGTTTELMMRVLSVGEGEGSGKHIRLLSRNDPPLIPCESCGKTATKVCRECIWSGEGWLCDECIKKHECGEDMLLPVVNSPRVGECGYTGEREKGQVTFT